MKRYAWTAFPLLLVLAAWTCTRAYAATANGSFSFDFSTEPACTATLTTNCIDHFEVWDVTGTPARLATVSTPAVAPQQPQNVNFTFKVGAPYGTRQWAGRTVAKDSSGTAVQSVDSTPTTVTVRPGTPASFTVTIQ